MDVVQDTRDLLLVKKSFPKSNYATQNLVIVYFGTNGRITDGPVDTLSQFGSPVGSTASVSQCGDGSPPLSFLKSSVTITH